MTKRFLIVGGIFGLLIGLLVFWHFIFLPSVIEKAIRGAPPPTETVSAEEAKQEQWVPYVRAIGTVKAAQGIDVAPKLGGVVREVGFADGAAVKAGQMLFALDDAQEQADLKAQTAQFQNADMQLARRKNLAGQGFTPQSDLDARQAERDAAEAAMESIKAKIADKVIRAPWDGLAGIRKVDVGAFVGPGMPLVSLQQADPVFVDFSVPEQEFARVKAGQKVELSATAWPGEAFSGVVDAVEAKVGEGTRAFMVRAKFANPDLKLVPGMFANVAVVTGDPQPVVTLPVTAVTYSLYGDAIFAVVPQPDAQEGTSDSGEPKLMVERRFVKLGEARDNRVSVVEGVKAGEEVVTAGQIKLRPGSFVRIDNSVSLEGERKTE